MAVTVSGTGITFNDATTQTTAATSGVTSAVAGNGIAVSGSTGAVTFSQACPTGQSVGSYMIATRGPLTSMVQNDNYASLSQYAWSLSQISCDNIVSYSNTYQGALSGTWKWLSPSTGNGFNWTSLVCRVS